MGRGTLTRLSLTQKIRLRHEEVKRWRKKCRVKKIERDVIDEIIKGTARTPAQAISFINNSRYIGFNPASFSPVICREVINKNLQNLLLQEAGAILPNPSGSYPMSTEAADLRGSAAENKYRICSRPYLPGVKEVAEIAHDALQNVVYTFERENRKILEKDRWSFGESIALGAWFDKTTANDHPLRITIMHVVPNETSHISPQKDKFPFWGAAVLCVQEKSSADSGITLRKERAFDFTWFLRDGDMIIITPKLVPSIIITASNKEAHALIVWF